MNDHFAKIRDCFIAALEQEGLNAQLRYADGFQTAMFREAHSMGNEFETVSEKSSEFRGRIPAGFRM